jgi:hypothetical protein
MEAKYNEVVTSTSGKTKWLVSFLHGVPLASLVIFISSQVHAQSFSPSLDEAPD